MMHAGPQPERDAIRAPSFCFIVNPDCVLLTLVMLVMCVAVM